MKWIGFTLIVALSITHAVVPPESASPLEQALQGFLNGIGDGDIDVTACVADLHLAEEAIHDAVLKFRSNSTGEALSLLGVAVHDMSIAVTPCQIAEAPARLDQLAAALHFASVQWVDDVLKIWVADAASEQEIEQLIASWESKDYALFGSELSALAGQLSVMLHCDASDKACLILQSILTQTAKVASNFGACLTAVTPLAAELKQSYQAYKAGDIAVAVQDLGIFLTGLGTAAGPCHFQDIENLLSQSGSKLSVVTVSAGGSIRTGGGIEITKYILDLMKSIEEGDYTKAGVDISALLAALRANGCNSEMCILMDGLLQGMGIIAYDMGGCKTTLEAAQDDFASAATAFRLKQYGASLNSLKAALDSLSVGVQACDLSAIGTLIDQEASKLENVNVTAGSDVVALLIEGADIYAPLSQAIELFEEKQFAASGAAIGNLVTVLRQTVCKSDDKVCVFIESLLQGLDVFVSDLGECASDLIVAVVDIEDALVDFHQKDYKNAVQLLAAGLKSLADGIRGCRLNEISDLIASQAGKLSAADVQVVVNTIHVVVEGADVYDDVFDAATAFKNGDYASAGRSLSALLKDTQLATCTTPVCHFITALIEAIATISPDLSACEVKLEAAWADFDMAATSIRSGNSLTALKALSRGLDETATAIQPCDLPQEAAILANIAQELGFNSIGKDITGAITIIVSGSDIYDGLFQAGNDVANKDYSGAGEAIGRVINDVLRWHYSNGCSSPMCFILEGMTKALGILESNFQTCESDINGTLTQFEGALAAFRKHKAFIDVNQGLIHGTPWNIVSTPEEPSIETFDDDILQPVVTSRRLMVHSNLSRRLSWWNDVEKRFKNIINDVESDVKTDWNAIVGKLERIVGDDNVKTGFSDLATAFDDLAQALPACHAEELALVIAKLAVELGAPSVGWVSTSFNIILNGAQLYDDAFNAVVDYEAKNYVGFGYEMAKFAILIVKTV